MKKRDPKIYARVLYEATRELRGRELTAVIERFVALLAREHALGGAGRIIEEFLRYAKEKEGIREIEIASAHELAAATLNQIKKAFGEKVEVAQRVEPALLGGVVVRARDKIFDASLRTQLNNLKLKMAT